MHCTLFSINLMAWTNYSIGLWARLPKPFACTDHGHVVSTDYTVSVFFPLTIILIWHCTIREQARWPWLSLDHPRRNKIVLLFLLPLVHSNFATILFYSFCLWVQLPIKSTYDSGSAARRISKLLTHKKCGTIYLMRLLCSYLVMITEKLLSSALEIILCLVILWV